jgi:hypothetical protein
MTGRGDGSEPVTGTGPDGRGWLTPADVTVVLAALADAAAYRAEKGWHDQIPAYRAVARALGDDR